MDEPSLSTRDGGRTVSTEPLSAEWLNQWARDVFEGLEIGVLVLGQKLKIEYRNSIVADRFPTVDEVDALFAGARFLVPFDGWRSELTAVLHACVEKRFEFAIEQRGGGVVVWSVLCRPLRKNGQGRAYGVITSVRDVTYKFGLEERLAVSERLASIGKLAAKVAHELNNPLDGILRYVNLALRLTRTAQDEKLRNYLSESKIGLMRMMRIISELLEFSRSSREQVDCTGINELIDQAIEEFTPRAKDNRIVIAADFKNDQMPAVRGSQLYQVIGNLIKNAIDAMPKGGRLSITSGLVNDHVVIRVADTGPGLPENPAQVFEPFFTTKKAGEGTGLGLAICRDFIERMGGAIEAVNDPDGGAVFTLRIPESRCEQAPKAFSGVDPTAILNESEPYRSNAEAASKLRKTTANDITKREDYSI